MARSDTAGAATKDGGIVRIGGCDFVLVPAEEYRALIGGAGVEAKLRQRRERAEDGADERAAADYRREKEAGTLVTFPESVAEAIAEGDSVMGAVRKWRGMTQAEIAAATGLTQGHYSALESGKRQASLDTLRALARALAVPLSVLVDD